MLFDKYLAAIIIFLCLLSFLKLLACRKIAGAFFRFLSIRRLKKKQSDFTPQEIKRAVKYYIRPDCQSIDPVKSEESIHTVAIRNSLWATMDQILDQQAIHKHYILLADSGMGKTSFLLNYYSCYLGRWRKSLKMKLNSLDSSGLENRIKSIPSPENTVLLLDGYDEDAQAVQDRIERLHEIIKWTSGFHRVIITCQTQFFPKDKEILQEEGIFRVESSPEGDETRFPFYKLYLSPFSDINVRSYLKKRFSILRKKYRKKSQDILANIPNFSMQPLLLTYINDLINSDKSFKNCYQIYSEIVDAWLEREQKRFADKKTLHEFSCKLAVELYAHRKMRGSERISSNEIEPIASRFRINLKKWHLSSHSLLNRDSEGNYKFVHRSIQEFLFTQRILENDQDAFQFPVRDWTEQIKSFLLDGLEKRPWRFPVYFVPFKRKSWQMGEKGKTVEIKPFEISIYPITNREYEEFDPSHRDKRNEYSNRDDHPVVNITWEEADQYCRWLSEKTGDNYRLPQEIEWEFVASGGGQRKYPWGNEKPSKELANYIDSKIMKAAPVNSYPLGMTPEGLFNMAGNVWEWCDDWYNKKQKFRVIRGGSFFDLEHYLHCVFRIGAEFNDSTNYIGFRVVRDILS